MSKILAEIDFWNHVLNLGGRGWAGPGARGPQKPRPGRVGRGQGWVRGGTGRAAGLELGWAGLGLELGCGAGLGWARSSGFEKEIGLLENVEVMSRPEKKVSRWPSVTSNFYLFLS